MELVIIGPPGSGKSSLAKELGQKYDFTIISSGDIAREMAEANPAEDQNLKHGGLAPEANMRYQIAQKIDEAESHFILEGFPRGLAQYIYLRQLSVDPIVIWLDCSVSVCIDRLCLRSRADDNPDAITQRLETYQTLTLPLIDVLREDYKLIKIEVSDLDVDQVLETAAIRLERFIN